jgi:DUF1680 family protein
MKVTTKEKSMRRDHRTIARKTTLVLRLAAIISGAAILCPPPSLSGGTTDHVTAHPFDAARVRLLDGPFRQAMERDRAYLRGLELDRLLHTFRLNAGIPSSAKPLGGWEAPTVELRGHFVGHYLSACALMYAAADDRVLKSKADTLVAGLAKCQDALGNGFLSAYPESFFDRVETGKGVWAPWYTLHKIMAGLLDVYSFTGNRQALDVLTRFAGWAKRRTDRLDDSTMQKMLRVEFGGMNEVIRNLYAVTGNPDHLALARRFDHTSVLEPLAAHQDKLKGLHANTQIPKIVGAAREYEISGDRRFYDVATYFWDEVVRARSYATGGTSYDEHWGNEPYRLSTHIGRLDHETCCTYNMLKLTRHLFSWEPDVRYADYYERALLNGIMSVQNPADGMTMYYVPMGSGWFKTFGTPTNSFWCCTGTGVELFAGLGSGIFFADQSTLYVNLFIPSELSWIEKGVSIVQTTNFPDQQGTSITIKTAKPAEFTLSLRIPGWTQQGGGVKINGKRQEMFAGPGSYLTLRRLWKTGDRVDLELPMGLHLSRCPDNPNRAAILFGPVVLAGELGADTAMARMPPGEYGPAGDPVTAPFFVVKDEDLRSWIQPVEGKPLTFRTQGAGRPGDVTLSPYYRLFGQRYALYWDIYTEGEWKALRAAGDALPDGIIDSVKIGDVGSETDHNFQGFQVRRGFVGGTAWLSCGDWLKFDFKIPVAHPASLVTRLSSPDSGKVYSVFADGKELVASTDPGSQQAGESVVRYAIPKEMMAGKKQVSLIFRVNRGESSKRLLGVAVLKGGQ